MHPIDFAVNPLTQVSVDPRWNPLLIDEYENELARLGAKTTMYEADARLDESLLERMDWQKFCICKIHASYRVEGRLKNLPRMLHWCKYIDFIAQNLRV